METRKAKAINYEHKAGSKSKEQWNRRLTSGTEEGSHGESATTAEDSSPARHCLPRWRRLHAQAAGSDCFMRTEVAVSCVQERRWWLLQEPSGYGIRGLTGPKRKSGRI
jgi:hypothetical protein